jgi:2-polyprenyl-3-methyl-5-hydroxy-6-metoxy-1,4-benzoquinol methylase
LVEFTGERVVPDQVNDDLWSEHFARYAFARRYASGKRVLDAGSGTGYGTAELAQSAARVIGMDLAATAAEFAAQAFALRNTHYLLGSCEHLPFRASAFDLVVAFEVIEHLHDYRSLVSEAARVLTPEGIFIVSTPNKLYYAQSRAQTGPNPYHVHEFEASEFHAELAAAFPHVCLMAQNRVEAFAFHPIKTFWPAEARIDGGGGSLDDAHFFIAVCSQTELPKPRSFTYIPKAANLLREREQHVALLEDELERTKHWLAQTARERQDLLELHRKQKDELEAHNRWAQHLNSELIAANDRVAQLQNELASEQGAAIEVANGYERKVAELEADNRAKAEWAAETEARLTGELQSKCAELAACARLLDQAEATVIERTLWAQNEQAQRSDLRAALNASRWLKLGHALGLGPKEY